MKVLHIAHNIHSGGAATYVRRVLECQDKVRISKSILVGSHSGLSENEYVLRPTGILSLKALKAKASNQIDRSLSFFERTPSRKHRSFNFYGALKSKSINTFEADVIHLHWINHGLISLNQLCKINKPIVWSALDMWPFSGTEHYVSDENLTRFFEGYQRGNRPPAYGGVDLERIAFNFKLKLRNQKLLFIYPSVWLQQNCMISRIGRNFEAVLIPPPINTDLFKPLGQLPHSLPRFGDELTLGFGGGLSSRKGWGEVKKLFLHLLFQGANVRLIHFGSPVADKELSGNSQYEFVGDFSSDSECLVQTLNRLDVLLFPSHIEAFGLLAQEAQSCGVPVITRRGTGSEATLSPNKSGWLFSNESELIQVVNMVLGLSNNERSEFRKQSRIYAESNWSYEKVSRELYETYLRWARD